MFLLRPKRKDGDKLISLKSYGMAYNCNISLLLQNLVLTYLFLFQIPCLKKNNNIVIHGQTSPCDSMVCFNGSPCVETALVAVCDCTPGYTGKQCETNIDDCQVPFAHQCQNNAGCMDGLNNYTCQCLSGWEGPFCEKVS